MRSNEVDAGGLGRVGAGVVSSGLGVVDGWGSQRIGVERRAVHPLPASQVG